MRIITTIVASKIVMREESIEDTYSIEEHDNMFYVSCTSGYSEYDHCTEGHKTIESAIWKIKGFFKNYYKERCIDEPTGWSKNK